MSDIGDNSHSIAAEDLRKIVERIERIDDEIAAMKEDRKEFLKEAKAKGYDMRTLREVLRLRKLDEDERSDREALRDLYCAALGVFG